MVTIILQKVTINVTLLLSSRISFFVRRYNQRDSQDSTYKRVIYFPRCRRIRAFSYKNLNLLPL